ncbi:MAG TPA: hypothetical protein VFR47_12900 [Anaerolineales bacterium]|nr:hypothetical protein [Anaerolineales bacterium]
MSYYSEHQRLKPVLDLARQLDIATNPHPSAIFEAGNGGLQVWCTPQDHPRGWNGITMIPGAFSKPCEYVGSVHWQWDDDKIVGLQIETAACALAEQMPEEYCNVQKIPEGSNRHTIFSREADIDWLKEKVAWLFATAGVSLPSLAYEQVSWPDRRPYLLAYYEAANDEYGEYVVIVSPASDPHQFCRVGYQLVCTLEIGNARDFPINVILRPDHEHREALIEPDPASILGQAQTASRAQEDTWLETAFEDRGSGQRT